VYLGDTTGITTLAAYSQVITPAGGTGVAITCGWDVAITSADGARNRISTGSGTGVMLDGVNFADPTGGIPIGIRAFTVVLPASGQYKVWLALGDGNAGNAATYGSPCGIYDGGTAGGAYNSGGESLKQSLAYGAVGASQFVDAAGNLLSPAAWNASNSGAGGGTPVTLTFATTTFKLVIGDATNNMPVAHLRIQQVSGGGSATYQPMIYQRKTLYFI
jgi:hypothetical protein